MFKFTLTRVVVAPWVALSLAVAYLWRDEVPLVLAWGLSVITDHGPAIVQGLVITGVIVTVMALIASLAVGQTVEIIVPVSIVKSPDVVETPASKTLHQMCSQALNEWPRPRL